MNIFEKLNINLPQDQKNAIISSIDYSLRYILLSRAAETGKIEDLPYGMLGMLDNCEGDIVPTLRLWLTRCPLTKLADLSAPLKATSKERAISSVNAVLDGFKEATQNPTDNRKLIEGLENLKWQFDYSQADTPFKLSVQTCNEILEQSRHLIVNNLNSMFASAEDLVPESEKE